MIDDEDDLDHGSKNVPSTEHEFDDSGINDLEFIPKQKAVYDWAEYKRIERQNSERNSKNQIFKNALESIGDDRKFILIKNNLIDLSVIKRNFFELEINEFQAKQFHYFTCDRDWTESELKLYSHFWARKLEFMKNCSGAAPPQQHRSSYKQIMKKHRLVQILDFLLENSVPAAQESFKRQLRL